MELVEIDGSLYKKVPEKIKGACIGCESKENHGHVKGCMTMPKCDGVVWAYVGVVKKIKEKQ